MLRIVPTKREAECLLATLYRASRAKTRRACRPEQSYRRRFGLKVVVDAVADGFEEDRSEGF